MRHFVLVLVMAFVVSSLWAGIAFADCDSQLQICDQGCQYIKDDAARLRCQNGCLSGYFKCLKRRDGKIAAIMNEKFVPCGMETSSYVVEAGEEVTVNGTLVRVVAIGGETTGWAIDLNQPLEVEGETVSRIEIDLVNIDMDLAPFEGVPITAAGTLVKRLGIERGSYWVIEI